MINNSITLSSQYYEDYAPGNSFISFLLEGYRFYFTNGVYLCGSDYTGIKNYINNTSYFSGLKYINDFVTEKSLSAFFPPFSGYQLTNYEVVNDNFLRVVLPPVNTYLSTNYQYNVIVKNRGGYSITNLNFSVTPTPTITPTRVTPTPTPSITPTNTVTPTITQTPTTTPTVTPTVTITITPTITPTPSVTTTTTPTVTPTVTPSITTTTTPTTTPTITPTITVTPTVTVTPSITPTNTVTPTITRTPSNVAVFPQCFYNTSSPPLTTTIPVNLGLAGGAYVYVSWNSYDLPNRYQFYWQGNLLYDTGFTGNSAYNSQLIALGYPPVAGPASGQDYFIKPIGNSWYLTVVVTAPFGFNSWQVCVDQVIPTATFSFLQVTEWDHGTVGLNVNPEYVTITNTHPSQTLPLSGVLIVSHKTPPACLEQNNKFTFGVSQTGTAIQLPAGESVTLYSGSLAPDTNLPYTIKWTGQFVWNNDGDRLRAFDPDGVLIFDQRYGNCI